MNYADMEMRAVYGHTLKDLIAENPEILCLEADLSKANGLNPVVPEHFPANFINIGVSEANMICISAGLANEGKIPFCSTFTCFASRRVYDQIMISVAYANNNVKIVGTTPGITQVYNGGTHMDFWDLAIMRVMPNMHVYSPCDPWELRSMMRFMASSKQPTYMQLLRMKVEPLFDDAYQFDPYKAVVLQEGKDITLISTGFTVQLVVKAAQQLKQEGIQTDVLHYPSIKPFDTETLINSAKKTGVVVTVENQSVLGGLGGIVCETLSEKYPTRVKRLGIHDQFGEVASLEYLLNKHHFNVQHIVDACKAL